MESFSVGLWPPPLFTMKLRKRACTLSLPCVKRRLRIEACDLSQFGEDYTSLYPFDTDENPRAKGETFGEAFRGA